MTGMLSPINLEMIGDRLPLGRLVRIHPLSYMSTFVVPKSAGIRSPIDRILHQHRMWECCGCSVKIQLVKFTTVNIYTYGLNYYGHDVLVMNTDPKKVGNDC